MILFYSALKFLVKIYGCSNAVNLPKCSILRFDTRYLQEFCTLLGLFDTVLSDYSMNSDYNSFCCS